MREEPLGGRDGEVNGGLSPSHRAELLLVSALSAEKKENTLSKTLALKQNSEKSFITNVFGKTREQVFRSLLWPFPTLSSAKGMAPVGGVGGVRCEKAKGHRTHVFMPSIPIVPPVSSLPPNKTQGNLSELLKKGRKYKKNVGCV